MPSQGSVDVAGGFDLALWDGAPLVEGKVRCRCGHEAVNVAVVEGLKANVPACENWRFDLHGYQYAMSFIAAAMALSRALECWTCQLAKKARSFPAGAKNQGGPRAARTGRNALLRTITLGRQT